MFDSKMRLGEFLLKSNLVSQVELEQALDQQSLTQKPLGEIFIDMGVLDEEQLIIFLSKQFNYSYIKETNIPLECKCKAVIETFFSEDYLVQNQFFPFSLVTNILKIILINPLDLALLDNLKILVSYEIEPIICSKKTLTDAIKHYFGEIQKVNVEMNAEESAEQVNLATVMSEASEGQVVRVVNLLIMQAVEDLASDIHFEPLYDGSLQIRYRIDGTLVKKTPPPKELYLAIISRIKILSHMDISEKRLPQDGSMVLIVNGQDVDFRVSTIATIYGEKLVIRILNKDSVPLDITRLGLSEISLQYFREALAKPYGLMLVTGPTGSGKTTTLYASLQYMNDITKNIMSIEDPVEFKLEGIVQVSVKEEIGFDFSQGLRAFLRQDPDVIMVGEVRDKKTAQMSLQAAMTGHFVLTTLHTNTALQALSRLIDMGVELVSVTSALIMIVAQRLLKKLCLSCKEKYVPEEALLKDLKISSKDKPFFKAVGCKECQLGYKGRIAVHEIVMIDDELRSMILRRETEQSLEEHAIKHGMISLRLAALEKVLLGETSLEEAIAFLD